jgi:hypothetical protein
MISDEIREQRKKLKGQGLKAHLDYFWEYYKIQFLLVVLGLAVLIYMVNFFMSKKERVFGVTVLNVEANEEEGARTWSNDLSQDIVKLLDVNTSKERVDCDFSRYQAPGTSFNQADMATQTAILSGISSSDIDVVIMDRYNFDRYVDGGTIQDLRDVLSKKELEKYQDQIYYIDGDTLTKSEASKDDMTSEEVSEEEARKTEALDGFVKPDPTTMKDPIPAGLLVNDMPYISKQGYYKKTVAVLGITTKTKRPNDVKKFIKMLEN